LSERFLKWAVKRYYKSLGCNVRMARIRLGKPFESRIIGEDELTRYLDEGWDLGKELSNGKIVVRRPLET